MSDFVELGLEAADKIIDYGFDKLPDEVFAPRESLRNIRKRRHNKHPQLDHLEGRPESPGSPETTRRTDEDGGDGKEEDHGYYYSDEEDDHQSRSRRQDRQDIPLPRNSAYSPSNPRSDPYYQEAQRRTRNGYEPPYEPLPPVAYPAAASAPQTPSTYAPPYAYQTYRPLSPSSSSPPPGARRSRSSHRNHDRSRPNARRRPSSTDGTFSTSGRGLGASGVGALAGGFLAQAIGQRLHSGRAKKGRGHGKGKERGRGMDPIALTLLGAAIGGLGANLAESAYERRRREQGGERDRDWDRDRDREQGR